MAAPPTHTKAELLEALRSSGEELLTKLRAMPPAAFEEGRYEHGWNGRQILAHVASIEWTYPRLIELANAAAGPAPVAQPSVRVTNPGQAAGVPTRVPRGGGINDYNERQVAKRAGATVADLLDEFEKNRAATIAAFSAADEALLSKEIRSAGGITGPLAGVVRAVAVEHILAHMRDILGPAA